MKSKIMNETLLIMIIENFQNQKANSIISISKLMPETIELTPLEIDDYNTISFVMDVIFGGFD